MSGVTLQLFTDPNGDGNPSDGVQVQVTTTDASGYYELLNLNTGHYVVVETDLPGYASSTPVNNRLSINVTNLTAFTNVNFFDYLPAPSLYSTISGTVWNDTNGNGTNDVGETGVANVEIDLVQDVNSNSLADSGEPVAASVVTDASGNYSFAGVTPGHYVIREMDLYGYYSTGDSQPPNDNQINFVSTNGIVSTNNNFFDRQSPIAVNDTNSTVYFVPVTIYPLTNDISPNGDALVITNVTSANGIVIINPGGTNITFTPTNAGTASINYTISDAHGGTSTAIITLGVLPAPLSVSANNAVRGYGQANPVFGGILTGVVNGDNLTATYASPAGTNSPAGNYPIVPSLVDPNGRLANYTVGSTNGTLTVSKALPAVNWPVPTNMVYGTLLGTNQNDATSTTPGSFSYNPTNGTVLAAGTNTLSVVFTAGDTNYTTNILSVPLVVTPAPLSVSANNAVRGYGQANPVFGGILTGVVNGDNLTATYASPAGTNSPAGNYPIVPSLVDPNGRLANYTVGSTNGTLTVSKALPAVNWPVPTNMVYGTLLGTNQNDATSTTPGSFSYNPTNGTVLAAGTNTLSVVFTAGDTNYTTNILSVPLVVTPAPLSVSANNAVRGYGQANPVFGGILTGVVNGDNLTATYASPAGTNSPAGNYPIVPSLVDPNGRLANYTVGSTNGTLTVSKALPAVNWPVPTNMVYGTLLGTNQNDATSTTPGSFSYNPTNGTVLAAGTNTLSVVFTAGDTNYTTNILSVPLVVTPAPLSVSANNAVRGYGQANPVFGGILTGVVNGDNLTATYASPAGTNSPAGNYPIVPSLVDPNGRLANYTVGSTNGTLTVSKALPAVNWPVPTNMVYGTLLGTNQNDATSTTPGSFSYNPTNGTVLAAGTNTLSVVFTAGDTNYTTNILSVPLVVTPAPLSVSANNAVRGYGQANPVFGGILTGVVNGDNLTATYASPAGTNSPAGNYPIVPSLVDPNGRLANYTVGSTNGTLTVSKALPAVNWPVPTNMVYGTLLGTNQNDATSTTPGSFSYNPTNGTVLAAGTNTLSVVFTAGDTNYTTNILSVPLVVTPAPLSVSANNAVRGYGQANPVFGGILTGVVNGDNLTATYASPAGTNSPAGNYPIVPSLVDPNGRLANYTVGSTNGTLTVSKALPAVNWPVPTNMVYGTLLGTNQNDATSTTPGSFSYNPTNGTVLAAGTNTLSVVFTAGDTNYTTNILSVPLVVTPAPLSVSANNAVRGYGQANPVFGGILTGVVNGDNLTATYASPAGTNSPAGNYPIVPSLVDPNGRLANYTVGSTNGTLTVSKALPAVNWPVPTNMVYGTLLGTNQNDATSTTPGSFSYNPTNGTVLAAGTNTLSVVFTAGDTNYTTNILSVPLVVTPAPLSVSANNAVRGYGQANPVFGGILTGVVNGDNLTATYGSPAGTNSPAGNYPIVPSLVDPNGRLANYTVGSTNGTLTITNAVAVAADIAVFKSGPASGVAGSNLVYTITVTNLGPATATNAVLTDLLPAGFAFVSATPATATVSNNLVSWPGFNLTNTASSIFTVTAVSAEGGNFTNIAFATTGTFDPNPTNNDGSAPGARVNTSVTPSADLIVQLSGQTNVTVGHNFTCTVTLTNAGPSTATGVTLQDNLPASLIFINVTGGGVFSNNIIIWPTIASFANGATTNFTITLNAPGLGQFTNVAFATSATFDPNPANNDGSSLVSQVQTNAVSAHFGISVGTNLVQIGTNSFLVGANAFNPQTGLFEEQVVVTNIGVTTVAGVRLYVGGLRSGVTLYNATGMTNGTPYVEYDASLNPDSTVTFALEFYDVNRLAFTNTLTVVEIPFASLPSAGTNGVAVNTEFMDTRVAGDTRFVIEFPTIPGKSYTIIYSTDMVTWKIATPSVTANANVTQWYDDGPPKTDSKPASAGSRFYRVIQD